MADQPAVERLESELRTTRAELEATVEDLKSTNERFRVAQELSPDGFLIFRPLRDDTGAVNDFLWIYENDAAARMNDTNPQEVRGKRVSEVLPHHDKSPFHTAYKQVAETGEVRVLEEAFYDQDTFQQRRWFRVAAVPTIGGDVAILVQDVTARKLAEEAQARLAAIVDSSEDAILSKDLAGTILTWNHGAERMFGYSAAEAIGRPMAMIIPEERKREEDRILERIAAGERVDHYETERITKDGLRRSVWITIAPLLSSDGDVIGASKIVRDITDRKRYEESAQAHRRLLETVLDHVPAAVNLIRGSDLRLQLTNPAYQAIAPGKDMVGKTLDELWPETGREFGALCRKVLETGEPHHVDDELFTIRRRLDGPLEEAHFSWSLHRVPLPGGEGWGVLNTAWETTDRKRAEEALRESENRFRTMANTIPQLAWMAKPDGFIYWYNDRWYDYTGTTPQQMQGWGWQSVHDPEALPAVLERWKGSIASGEPFDMVFPLRGADARLRPFLTRVQPLKDSAGRVVQWFGTNTDVSEIEEARNAAQESEEKYRQLFEGMLEGFAYCRMVFDDDHHPTDFIYLTVNDAFARLTRLENVIGKRITELVPGIREANPEVFEIYGRVAENGKPEHFETYVPALSSWLAISVYSPKKDHFVAVFDNITDRKRAEEELKEANVRLVDADRGKNQFLAVLSHELRNPLAAVRTAVHLLDHVPPAGEHANRARSVIDRQTAQLTRLVDDLLDVTRISRGKIQIQVEPIELTGLVRRTAEDHRALFATNGIEFELQGPDDPLWLDGDAQRLAQAVGNLLHNAAKFTGRGGRTVALVGKDDDGREAVITVRDTGVGISAHALPHLFQPFMQVEDTLDRARGGLGLGLALVKSLVEMHGGTVSAQSAGVGLGSEFTLRLPLRSAPSIVSVVTESAAHRRRRVLNIEDNVDAADSLRHALALAGHDVEVAYDGPEGVEKARDFAPEIVLCDIGLPGLSGYDVARTLRNDAALASVRLVALTGYALPEDVAKAREAGFDLHVAKPASPERLQDALR